MTDSTMPLSPREVAELLRSEGFTISQRTVDRMVKRGELDAYVTAGGWQRVRVSEVERWMEQHR